jgi:hypothetical protein
VGVAYPDLDLLGESGTFDIVAGDSGVMLIYLQGIRAPSSGRARERTNTNLLEFSPST